MKIVADDAIPWLPEAFGDLGDLAVHPGPSIDADVLQTADVLLTRSVTRVDENLLRGTNVRFVGSATAGVDHVDRPALASLGVAFAHAPGCNAQGVVEYVLTQLLEVAQERGETWLSAGAVGVVGFGQIGHRLVPLLRALGLEVTVSDPPLAHAISTGSALELSDEHERAARNEAFVTLPELLAHSQAVTFHVPLVTRGAWPTPHLLSEQDLRLLDHEAVVINSSRGAVVDNEALRRWLDAGAGIAALDVWEHEPDIDLDLLRHPRVRRATPHIAGYTVEGKARGTAMLHAALCRHLGRPPLFFTSNVLGASRPACVPAEDTDTAWLTALLRSSHALDAVDSAVRALAEGPAAGVPSGFERLRKGYRMRRELSHRLRPELPDFARCSLPTSVAGALDRLFPPAA